ncbi:methyltransferase-like protein 22 [Oscarella lobularis]|uniref:methyltransferase-like protein 22 n=1 Tax=Oscarella lobularis TaxID=121494 RepID=UPI003313153F
MNDSDLVLSDVHVRCTEKPNERGVAVTRFVAKIIEESDDDAGIDEDGDTIVKRRQRGEGIPLVIEHAMATRLKDVGQQVWNGALLMADFILSNKDLFIGTCAIELGAGTGLTSLVLSRYADLVFCTDVGDGVLSCCQRNVERNIGEIDAGIIQVRALNWADPDAPEGSPSSFGWTAADIDRLEDLDVIVAADVIYNDYFTEMFVNKVRSLMLRYRKCKRCYVALEKRYNFTISKLDTVAPAFDYFKHCLDDLHGNDDTFVIERLPIGFSSMFAYERSHDMELWCVYRNESEGVDSRREVSDV